MTTTCLSLEALENLPGEIGHRHAGHAHAPLVDGRLVGHAAGHADRRLKHGVQERPGAVLSGGKLVSVFHLARIWRFAQHHAVEARGHGEQVPHGDFIAMVIEPRDDRLQLEMMEAGQETGDLLQRRLFGLFRWRRRFPRDCRSKPAPPRPPEKSAAGSIERFASLTGRESQLLPKIERRIVVATADDLKLH